MWQTLKIKFILLACCTDTVIFTGKFPEGVLCVLPDVTTTEQRCIFQDTVQHGNTASAGSYSCKAFLLFQKRLLAKFQCRNLHLKSILHFSTSTYLQHMKMSFSENLKPANSFSHLH